ncbi:uncharacterized protein EAF01_003363 [Botrytis porri]|uniref:uncharacterized protein n=1 Tax=Botrytis porri TaxID=87229 RepID=UPI0019016547|nr:uncharacterized protein EAF01_003363 [Botrytis porri]KAF7909645.1 hypothetical protein EAF01_003363 [Botrytis porri]
MSSLVLFRLDRMNFNEAIRSDGEDQIGRRQAHDSLRGEGQLCNAILWGDWDLTPMYSSTSHRTDSWINTTE